MSTRRIVDPRGFRLWAVLLSFALLMSCPLVQDTTQAQTETVYCGDFQTLELKYDDGIAFGTVRDLNIGCAPCYLYQGVQFSLPEGCDSAALVSVHLYLGGKGKTELHIMDAAMEYIGIPITCSANGEAWYQVPTGDRIVPNRFWIFTKHISDVMPFYDTKRTGTSNIGDEPGLLNADPDNFPRGDFLIRAVIVPQVNVGAGQDFETIQAAVDSVWDGWTIAVHEGTYGENVTVDKSVTIKSVSGPDRTVVHTSESHPNSDVFRITASCVRLSGFTIQGSVGSGTAGVHLEDVSGCVVSGNVIKNNEYGVYVSDDCASNILLENVCAFNTNGIYVDGSGNYIMGNSLHGNTARVGSAAYLSVSASANQLRFNSVTIHPGTDPVAAASAQVYNQNSTEEASAIENWWGTDTGPSNAGGQGPLVGDVIRYDPWLTKQPVRVGCSATGPGAYAMDARRETNVIVVKEGIGTPVVSTATFAENPFGEFPGNEMGKWIDVLFDKSVGVDQLEVRLYYTVEDLAAAGLKEESLRFFWWNGEEWKKCSKTSVDTKDDFVWTRLNLKTKPTSNDLGGTMFAVGVPKSGFAWWLIPIIVVIVLLLLIVFRLVWVLVARRGGGYTSID